MPRAFVSSLRRRIGANAPGPTKHRHTARSHIRTAKATSPDAPTHASCCQWSAFLMLEERGPWFREGGMLQAAKNKTASAGWGRLPRVCVIARAWLLSRIETDRPHAVLFVSRGLCPSSSGCRADVEVRHRPPSERGCFSSGVVSSSDDHFDRKKHQRTSIRHLDVGNENCVRTSCQMTVQLLGKVARTRRYCAERRGCQDECGTCGWCVARL